MSKISIIIPIFNSDLFLTDCLDSVLGQSHTNLEVICIDDASTDNSLNILNNYAIKDSRVKIIVNQKNSGQGYSRNIGIEAAIGEYIGFVDSDDTIEPNYYSEALFELIKYNADISSNNIFYSDQYNIREGDWPKYLPPNGKRVIENTGDKLAAVYANCSTSACKHLYKTNFIKSNQIAFLEGRYHEDQYFVMKAFVLANRVVCPSINSPRYYYRIRQGSTTKQKPHTKNHKKFYFDQVYVFSKILDLMYSLKMDNTIIESLKKEIYQILLKNLDQVSTKHTSEYLSMIVQIFDDKTFIKHIKRKLIFKALNISNDLNKLRKRYQDIKHLIRSW